MTQILTCCVCNKVFTETISISQFCGLCGEALICNPCSINVPLDPSKFANIETHNKQYHISIDLS